MANVIKHDNKILVSNQHAFKVDSSIDSNIIPENIKEGINILGVEGTYTAPEGPIEAPFEYTFTENGEYNFDASGWSDMRAIVDVNPAIRLTSETVTPTTQEQIIQPSPGVYLGEVIVEAVTSDIDSNIIESNIKKDVTILGITGTYEPNLEIKEIDLRDDESMQVSILPSTDYDGLRVAIVRLPEKITGEANPSTQIQRIIPREHAFFKEFIVSPVTASIDSNIIAENIKKDVTILGVTGTLESGGINHITKMIKGEKFDIELSDFDGVTNVPEYCFSNNKSIKKITFPDNITLGNYACDGCGNLETVIVNTNIGIKPQGVYVFRNCSKLTSTIYISAWDNKSWDTVLDAGFFNGCTLLQTIVFCGNVNTLFSANAAAYNNPLHNCTSLEIIDFSRFTIVPTLKSTFPFINSDSALPPDYEIRVPSSLYNDWITATNWSDPSIVSHIVAV